MSGTPAVAGWLSKLANAAAPICPRPMLSCLSLRDPHPSLESFA
jgi:hypothetical protein